MKYVVTAEQAKEIDKFTIENVGIPSMVLMERAALAVVEKIASTAKRTDKIVCVCGVGNNGGDGVAIARILHQQGYAVSIALTGNRTKATDDNQRQVEIAKKIGVSFVNNLQEEEYNVIVDGIFGVGLSRNVEGPQKKAIETFSDVFGNSVTYGVYSGEYKEMDADFVFATNITMCKSLELFAKDEFDYI